MSWSSVVFEPCLPGQLSASGGLWVAVVHTFSLSGSTRGGHWGCVRKGSVSMAAWEPAVHAGAEEQAGTCGGQFSIVIAEDEQEILL